MRRDLTITLGLSTTFTLLLIAAAPAFAHSDGLDKDGCHVSQKTGKRHCHAPRKKHIDLTKPARAGAQGVLYGALVRIIDGDTLAVRIQGADMAFRLSGIDAPELSQPFGPEAMAELAKLIGTQQCVMEVVEADSYGRTVVHLWVGDQYVNAEMMRRGMAWFDTEYA